MRPSFLTALLLLPVASLLAAEPAAPNQRSAQVRSAVERGLTIVQKAARNYPKHRECFSCHHQTLPMLAIDLASRKNVPIDEEVIQAQAQFTWDSFHGRRDSMLKGKGIGGASMTVGYGLWALFVAQWKADTTTEAMVEYLLKKQNEDGGWRRSSDRPPLEESNMTCTILAAYYADKFATPEQKPRVAAATARAKEWVEGAKVTSHEDLVSKLGALALLRSAPASFKATRDQVLAAQNDDGSWSQLEDMEGDAYATGLTLFTLHRVRTPITAPPFQRGIAFLLKTQKADGSWHVKTRSKPIQELFDNGDPHGKDQFISVAATSWATAALTLALPQTGKKAYDEADKKTPVRVSQANNQVQTP